MTDAVDVALPPMPWADDIEAWLEASNADEIGEDIRAYAIQAVAQERERCAKLAEQQNSHGVFIAGLIRAQPEPQP